MARLHSLSIFILFIWFYSNCIQCPTITSGTRNVNVKTIYTDHSDLPFIHRMVMYYLHFVEGVFKVLLFAIPIVIIYMVYENYNEAVLQQKLSNIAQTKISKQKNSNQAEQSSNTKTFQRKTHQRLKQYNIQDTTVEQQHNTQDTTVEQQHDTQDTTVEQQHDTQDIRKQQHKAPAVRKKQCNVQDVSEQQSKAPDVREKQDNTQERVEQHNTRDVREQPKTPGVGEKQYNLQGRVKQHDTQDTTVEQQHNTQPVRLGLQLNKIIVDREPKDWVRVRLDDKLVYIYNPLLKTGRKRNIKPTSKSVILSNFLIPFEQMHKFWIKPEFYTESDLSILALTSKQFYIQFKKLSGTNEKQSELYLLHQAYKPHVIDISLRSFIARYDSCPPSSYVQYTSNAFEEIYQYLVRRAQQNNGIVRYECFWFNISHNSVHNFTAGRFLSVKLLEKREWPLKEFQSSKKDFKTELIHIVREYCEAPNRDIIPFNHDIDEGAYERFLKKMRSTGVPFCNCPKTLKLLFSSKKAPLNLILFWDIFHSAKLEIIFGILTFCQYYDTKTTDILKDVLKTSFSTVYNNENREYLREIIYEMMAFMHHGFFGNAQFYKKTQTRYQHSIAFDQYMLNIEAQVKEFLSHKVFNESLIAVTVTDD